MEKESRLKFLSKIFLGELSKIAILKLFGLLSLPALISLWWESITAISIELYHKPIIQWQLPTKLFLTSFLLILFFWLVLSIIHFHNYFIMKQRFFLFKYKGYEWKLLLPERNLGSNLPNCPVHGVVLIDYVDSTKEQKCPLCNISISENDYYLHPIAYAAKNIGIAMYDGHYKSPSKLSLKNIFHKKHNTV